jgi:hypothetical protein
MIPTGNLSTPGTPDYASLYNTGQWRSLDQRPHQGPRSSPRNGSLGSIFQICPERVGDVLKGIEEMSPNVTAGLLTLQLGNMSSNCSFDRQGFGQGVQFYQYTSLALWVPYGVSTMLYSHVAISTLWFIDSLGCCSNLQLISLIFAIMIMARNDTGDVHNVIFRYSHFNKKSGLQMLQQEKS